MNSSYTPYAAMSLPTQRNPPFFCPRSPYTSLQRRDSPLIYSGTDAYFLKNRTQLAPPPFLPALPSIGQSISNYLNFSETSDSLKSNGPSSQLNNGADARVTSTLNRKKSLTVGGIQFPFVHPTREILRSTGEKLTSNSRPSSARPAVNSRATSTTPKETEPEVKLSSFNKVDSHSAKDSVFKRNESAKKGDEKNTAGSTENYQNCDQPLDLSVRLAVKKFWPKTGNEHLGVRKKDFDKIDSLDQVNRERRSPSITCKRSFCDEWESFSFKNPAFGSANGQALKWPTFDHVTPAKNFWSGKPYQEISTRSLPVQPDNRSKEWKYCKKLFDDSSNLTKHLRTHTEEQSYKCKYCEVAFSRRSSLTNHLRTHTGEQPYTCKDCEKTFSLSSSWAQHLRTHTGERPFKCKCCDSSFSRSWDLIRHLRTHAGERPFKCEYCDRSFSRSSDRTRHLRTHTGERPFKCEYCDSTFSRSSDRTRHLRTHAGERPFKCEYCDSTFSGSSDLTRHQRTHTGEQPFKCKYCTASFKQSSHLKQHLRTHTGERPFKCDLCQTAFRQSAHLTQHLRTHTGERPFKCKYCHSCFSHLSDLIRHLRTHTGERPFKCEYCDSSFSRSSNLTRHLRTHTEEQTYQCNYCQLDFSNSSNLQRHKRNIHYIGKSFKCPLCGNYFTQQRNLNQHLLTKHEDDYESGIVTMDVDSYEIALEDTRLDERYNGHFMAKVTSCAPFSPVNALQTDEYTLTTDGSVLGDVNSKNDVSNGHLINKADFVPDVNFSPIKANCLTANENELEDAIFDNTHSVNFMAEVTYSDSDPHVNLLTTDEYALTTDGSELRDVNSKNDVSNGHLINEADFVPHVNFSPIKANFLTADENELEDAIFDNTHSVSFMAEVTYSDSDPHVNSLTTDEYAVTTDGSELADVNSKNDVSKEHLIGEAGFVPNVNFSPIKANFLITDEIELENANFDDTYSIHCMAEVTYSDSDQHVNSSQTNMYSLTTDVDIHT